MGSYWSRDAPVSVAQVRNEKAILPEWFNKETGTWGPTSRIDRAYEATWESGTTMYSGRVAPETGQDGTVYPGGTGQVYIPQDQWRGVTNPKGVITGSWSLK